MMQITFEGNVKYINHKQELIEGKATVTLEENDFTGDLRLAKIEDLVPKEK